MRLTFSEFAQLLYPYCGLGDTHTGFVTTLTNKIMTKPGSCIGDKHQNPMIDKDDRSRQYFYKGSRPMGQFEQTLRQWFIQNSRQAASGSLSIGSGAFVSM